MLVYALRPSYSIRLACKSWRGNRLYPERKVSTSSAVDIRSHRTPFADYQLVCTCLYLEVSGSDFGLRSCCCADVSIALPCPAPGGQRNSWSQQIRDDRSKTDGASSRISHRRSAVERFDGASCVSTDRVPSLRPLQQLWLSSLTMQTSSPAICRSCGGKLARTSCEVRMMLLGQPSHHLLMQVALLMRATKAIDQWSQSQHGRSRVCKGIKSEYSQNCVAPPGLSTRK